MYSCVQNLIPNLGGRAKAETKHESVLHPQPEPTGGLRPPDLRSSFWGRAGATDDGETSEVLDNGPRLARALELHAQGGPLS